MNGRCYFGIALYLGSALVLAACGGVGASPTAALNSFVNVPLQRPEAPEEYRDLTNPRSSREASAEGEALYQANCASCHGVDGRGGGVAAGTLDPKPADLTQTLGEMSDGYIFWRISEGGALEPFKSAMPAWKGLMDEEQIWQVISYLRSLG